jgi:hypothetical protein
MVERCASEPARLVAAKGIVEDCGYRRREREIGVLEGRLGEGF